MAPLRPEFGGDGRTIEDALKEAKAVKPKDHVHIASLQLALVAEKHRKRLEALGYTIEPEGTGFRFVPPTQANKKATRR
jgi:hypothetical protein